MSEPEPVREPAPTAGRRIVLPALAVLWLVATLWAAYRTVAGAPTGSSIGVAQAAIVLPSVVAAAVLAGTGVGLLVVAGLARRADAGRRAPDVSRPGPRAMAGVGGGVGVGSLAAGAVLLAYGSGPFISAIAATVGVAAVLGGAFCVVRPSVTVAAALAGALTAIAVGLARGAFAGRLTALFGAGDTAASQLSAGNNAQLAISALSGVAAGLVVFWYLRRSGAGLRWPAYLIAGGSAGLVLLASEVAVRVGGARLLAVAKATSPADRAVQEFLGSQRVNHALMVFFVGAFVALVAFGRTLPPRHAPEEAQTS